MSKPSVRAFTLLEIMLAVAILAVIAVAVYQFTDVTLQSAHFYTESADEDAINSGLRRLVEAQLASIPGGIQGAMLGMKAHGKDGEHDSLQIVCAPGNGVLASDARGNYEVLLEVRESPRRSGKYALGIERRPHEDDDDDDDDDDTAITQTKRVSLPSDWVPLVEGVRTLEIGYFDSRLNGWVEKWTDQSILPNLVRVRFGVDSQRPPYEFIAMVPGGGVRQGAPTFTPGVGQAIPFPGNPTPIPPRTVPNRQ